MLVFKKTLRGTEVTYYKERLIDGLSTGNRERDFIQESSARSKRNIIDYGLSNKWTHFITITFDPGKHDRFQYDLLVQKITNYFKNYKQRKDSEFKYLISPEQHKDGALHFHGLVKLSKYQYLAYRKTREKAKIFEHKEIRQKFGFNEFTEIYDHQEFITYYISKYVSKNYNTKITSQRFYKSKQLDQPKKLYVDEKKLKHEFRELLGIKPDLEMQFATKWKLSDLDYKILFRYQDEIKNFVLNK